MTPIEPMSNKRQSQLVEDPIGTPKRQSLVLDNYSVEPIGTPKRQSLILDFDDGGASKRQSQIFDNDMDLPLFNPLLTTKNNDDYGDMVKYLFNWAILNLSYLTSLLCHIWNL